MRVHLFSFITYYAYKDDIFVNATWKEDDIKGKKNKIINSY